MGQAAARRTEHRGLRLPRHARRQLLPGRADPGADPDLAFSGLRSDEISRLRAGCVRWQHDGQSVAADSRDILAGDAVCLLDVPVHKTGTAVTKPVDPIVGQAIETWQALRPAQPPRTDPKAGEQADLLFSVRAHPVAKT